MSTPTAKHASINLLPAHRWAALRRRQRIRSWSALVTVYGLVLAAAWGCWGLRSSLGAVTDVQQKQGTPAEQISGIAAQVEKLRAERASVTGAMVEARHTLDAARAVGHHPDWSVLLDLLAAMGAPPNATIVFEHVELQTRQAPAAKDGKPKPAALTPQIGEAPDTWGYLLVLEGLAWSQIDVVQFAAGLEQQELFESVSIVGTRPRDSIAPDAAGPHLVSFQINCTLTNTAAAAHAAPEKPALDKKPARPAAGGAKR